MTDQVDATLDIQPRHGAPVRNLGTSLAAVALLLGAGCLGDRPDTGKAEPTAPPGMFLPEGPAWDAPAKVQQYGTAYEPSLEADSSGRLYVAAHKGGPANEGTRLSSWLWMSEDQGRTWRDLPSPAQAHTFLPGVEGDLAVDAEDRVYFVDTYLADNTLSVWQASPQTVAWQSSRSVQATTGLDDRPWLSAAGDGVLYYLGDHVVADVPSPEGLAQSDPAGSRWWFYRSMDGGLTWSAGLALGAIGFGGLVGAEVGDFAGMCTMDAPRDAPGRVGAVCTTQDGSTLVVLLSADHGVTWQRREVASIATRPGYLFPSIVLRPDGTAVVAWIDDDAADGLGARVLVGVLRPDGTFTSADATPFEGTFGNLWLAVSPGGDVLLNVHGSPALQGPDHMWSLHAVQARLDDSGVVDLRHSLVHPDIGRGAFALGHFIQNGFAPDGSAYVAYQVQVGATAAESEIHVARLPPA